MCVLNVFLSLYIIDFCVFYYLFSSRTKKNLFSAFIELITRELIIYEIQCSSKLILINGLNAFFNLPKKHFNML